MTGIVTQRVLDSVSEVLGVPVHEITAQRPTFRATYAQSVFLYVYTGLFNISAERASSVLGMPKYLAQKLLQVARDTVAEEILDSSVRTDAYFVQDVMDVATALGRRFSANEWHGIKQVRATARRGAILKSVRKAA